MLEGEGRRGLDAVARVEGGRDSWRQESVVDLRGDDLRKKALVSVIRRLASQADDQAAFLERLDVGVDELALQFTDLTASVPRGLSQDCRNDLASLDRLLAELSAPGNSHLLDFDALQSAPEWARVRALAHKFLADLAVSTPGPDRS
jgi:hypothetical protein